MANWHPGRNGTPRVSAHVSVANLWRLCFYVARIPTRILVPIVTQSQLGYMTTQCTSLHTNRPNCLHYFLLSENVLNYKNGTKMFYVACRTLLVMLCVGKYYFVDFNGMFDKAAKFGN